MFLHALATTLIVGPFAFILGAWWASRDEFDKFDAAADRDRASDIAGRLQLKMDAIRDLIETPRTIRKGELSAIVNGDAEVARLRGA